MQTNIAKDLKAVREVFTNIKTQLASAATSFEGPLKVLFDEVTGKLGGLLDGLPKDEAAAVPIAESVLATLASATGLIALLSGENVKLKTVASADTLAAALAAGTHLCKADHEVAVAKAVEAAIASRTGAQGDLVPKATVDQLCSAAKDLGIKEGREAATNEAGAAVAAEKLATERTTALTTAGLPLPEDGAILRLTETEYVTAKTALETRIKTFTEAGLDLPVELLAQCWAPEADFKKFQKTVTSIPALKRAGRPAEPFASLPAGGGAASTARMLG